MSKVTFKPNEYSISEDGKSITISKAALEREMDANNNLAFRESLLHYPLGKCHALADILDYFGKPEPTEEPKKKPVPKDEPLLVPLDKVVELLAVMLPEYINYDGENYPRSFVLKDLKKLIQVQTKG